MGEESGLPCSSCCDRGSDEGGQEKCREQGWPQLGVLCGEHAGEGGTKRGSPSPVHSFFLWNDTWQVAQPCAWITAITNQGFTQGDEHSVRWLMLLTQGKSCPVYQGLRHPRVLPAAHSPGAPAAFACLLLTWNEEPNGMGVLGRNRL